MHNRRPARGPPGEDFSAQSFAACFQDRAQDHLQAQDTSPAQVRGLLPARGLDPAPGLVQGLIMTPARIDTDGPMYRGRDKSPFKSFHRSCQMAVKKAGITMPDRMYDLRHMFASITLSDGADLAALSKLVGHSNINTSVKVYHDVLRSEKERGIGFYFLRSLKTKGP